MKKFTTELKETIIDRLNDYKNTTVYGCDLAYTLFESENVNGSVLCNTYLTREFIKENFDLFGDLVQYVENNIDVVLNPFKEPEKSHVWLVMEGGCSLLSRLDFILNNWNDKFKLTDEVIKEITDQLRELNINDEDLF